jgi:hypothetical protein
MSIGPSTIRDDVKRQAAPRRWIGLVSVVAFGVGVVAALELLIVTGLALSRQSGLLTRVQMFLVLGSALLFIVGTIAGARIARNIACPKCGERLGPFTLAMSDAPRRKKINYCPYCAVNLDDPVPKGLAQADSITMIERLIWK